MALNTAVKRILLATLLGVGTPCALADSRPFGVLPEGALEIAAQPSYDSGVELPGGRVVISGDFNRVSRAPAGSEVVLLEANGAQVAGFAPRCAASADPGAAARSCRGRLLALPDGGFLLAGNFGAVDGIAARGLARFDANGTRITGFNPLRDTPGSVGALTLIGPWVHVAIASTTGASTRRFGLAHDAVVDPGFLGPAAQTIVADNLGRPFILTDSGIHRLDPESGQFDPTWTSGLRSFPGAIAHDRALNRLFVIERVGSGLSGAVRRLDPNAAVGLEPDWAVQEADPSVVSSERQSIDATGHGRVLLTDFATNTSGGSRSRQRLLDGADGSVLVDLLPSRQIIVLSTRPSEGWLVARPDLRWTNSDLDLLASFEPRVRRSAGVNDVARAKDGRVAIVGTFGEIDGLPRQTIARLLPSTALDRGWPAASPSIPFCWVVPCFPAEITINEAGDVLALQHLMPVSMILPPGLPIIWSGVAIDSAGRFARTHPGSNGRALAYGEHFYLGPLRSICGPFPFDHTIGRATRSEIFRNSFQYCRADTGWFVGNDSAPVDMKANEGFIYVAERFFENGVRRIRIRRAPVSGTGFFDRSFDVDLIEESNSPALVIAPVDGFLYVGGSIREVNGTPWTGATRFRLSDGGHDADWRPNIGTSAIFRLDVAAGWLYLMQAGQASAPPPTGFRAVQIKRIRIDRPMDAPSVITTNGLFGASTSIAPRLGRLIALPDGRAIVAGHFSEIGGVPRDGFAIVGSVEAILADGFE
jgi:hypothetical protein